MRSYTRYGGVALGLLLGLALGWAGYAVGYLIVQYVFADVATPDARRLAALACGIAGILLGVANGQAPARRR